MRSAESRVADLADRGRVGETLEKGGPFYRGTHRAPRYDGIIIVTIAKLTAR